MADARWAVPVLHAAWGTALIAVPARLLRLAGEAPSAPAHRLLRVLGARHLAQAVATAARPGAAQLRVGGAVDFLHAASCAGIAVASPHWRRPAFLGCLGATALGAAGIAASRSAKAHER